MLISGYLGKSSLGYHMVTLPTVHTVVLCVDTQQWRTLTLQEQRNNNNCHQTDVTERRSNFRGASSDHRATVKRSQVGALSSWSGKKNRNPYIKASGDDPPCGGKVSSVRRWTCSSRPLPMSTNAALVTLVVGGRRRWTFSLGLCFYIDKFENATVWLSFDLFVQFYDLRFWW